MCLHETQRNQASWPESTLATIHENQSDPEWVKRELATREGTSDFHRLQTYRLAVRQEMRKRGLAVLRAGGR